MPTLQVGRLIRAVSRSAVLEADHGGIQPAEVQEELSEDLKIAKCPCCMYQVCQTTVHRRIGARSTLTAETLKLSDEPDRAFEFNFTVDGNFAHQRYRDNENDYGRTYDDADLRVSKRLVDVHDEQPPKQPSRNSRRPVRDAPATESFEGCTDGWTAVKDAQSKPSATKQKELARLAETGIFVLVCRHGVVWKYLDIEGSFGEP